MFSAFAAPAVSAQANPVEATCHQIVQGKVAWDYEGNKLWAPGNLTSLCRGTFALTVLGRCFQRVMHRDVSWGGSTKRQWENATALCAGSNDGKMTVQCIQDQLRKGTNWQPATKQAVRRPPPRSCATARLARHGPRIRGRRGAACADEASGGPLAMPPPMAAAAAEPEKK